MELNIEDIRERAKRVITAVGAKDGGELAIAVLEDAHLALFLVMAADFLGSNPIAVIDHVEVVQQEGKEVDLSNCLVRVNLPMASMFDGFCKMRVKQFAGDTAKGFEVQAPVKAEVDNGTP